MPPSTKSLWIRPIDSSKVKVYYPKAGDWKELVSTGASPEPTPGEYEELEQEIAEVHEELEALTQRVVRTESYKASIDALSRRVERVERYANEARVNAYAAFVNGYPQFETFLIPAPQVGEDIVESQLPVHNTTKEILDAIYDGEFNTVRMMRGRFEGSELVQKKVIFSVLFEEDENGWTEIKLNEFTTTLGATVEKFTITRELKYVPGVAGKVNVYTIAVVEETSSESPFNPGGPTGPSSPGGSVVNP